MLIVSPISRKGELPGDAVEWGGKANAKQQNLADGTRECFGTALTPVTAGAIQACPW